MVFKEGLGLGIDGSVSKMATMQAWGLEFRSPVPVKTPDVASCACNPSAGGRGGVWETGRSQRLADKPVWPDDALRIH